MTAEMPLFEIGASSSAFERLNAEYIALNDRYMRLLTEQGREQRLWMQTAREQGLAAAQRALLGHAGSFGFPRVWSLLDAFDQRRLDHTHVALAREELADVIAAAVSHGSELNSLVDAVRHDAELNRAAAMKSGQCVSSVPVLPGVQRSEQ